MQRSKSAEKFVSFDQVNFKRINFNSDHQKEKRIGELSRILTIDKFDRKCSGSTATEIDDRLSPGNVTLLTGETALLACKIYNLGNKSVSGALTGVQAKF